MKPFLATLFVSGALVVSLMTGVHAQQTYPQDQQINSQGQVNSPDTMDNSRTPVNSQDRMDVSPTPMNSQDRMDVKSGTPMNSNDQINSGNQSSTGTYPKVSTLRPFSLEANYMSLPGYLRFLVYQRDGIWMDRQQAASIVNSQIATGGD